MIWQIISIYSKQCVLGWTVATSDMENMCLENHGGHTNTKIRRNTGSFYSQFTANFTHKSGAWVKKKLLLFCKKKKKKKKEINLIYMACVLRLSLGALQKPNFNSTRFMWRGDPNGDDQLGKGGGGEEIRQPEEQTHTSHMQRH